MVYKYIQKWVAIFVVSLGVISLSSSLQASFGHGQGGISTPATDKHLQQAYKLQKALQHSVPTLKAQANQ